jgi:hypothetical protein
LIGMREFLRREGLGNAPALLGAVAFGFGTHAFMLAVNAMAIAAFAWIPWVAVSARIFERRPSFRSLLVLTVVFAWQILAGHPQYLLYSLVLVVVLVTGGPGQIPVRRGLPAIAVALTIGFLLCSVLVLPATCYLKETNRSSSLTPSERRVDQMRLRDLAGYVSPWIGHRGFHGGRLEVRQHWATLHYIGLLPLLLALAAPMRGWRDYRIRRATWLVAVALLLALAGGLPGIGPVVQSLPPFTHTRHAALWLALADFGLAWLAAHGLSRVMAGSPRWRRAWWRRKLAGPAVVLTTLDLLSVAFCFQPSIRAEWFQKATAEEAFLARTVPTRGSWLRVVSWPPSDQPGVRPPGWLWGRDVADAIHTLRATLSPNLAAAAGFREIDGDNPLLPTTRHISLLRLATSRTPWDEPAHSILRRLSVTHVIADRSCPAFLRGVAFEDRSRIYEFPGLAPVRIVPTGAGIVREFHTDSSGEWLLRVRLVAPATVIVAETYMRGWRTTDALSRWPVRAMEEGLVGVVLPEGSHEVHLRYDPIEAKVGILLSLMVSVLLACAGAWQVGPFMQRCSCRQAASGVKCIWRFLTRRALRLSPMLVRL